MRTGCNTCLTIHRHARGFTLLELLIALSLSVVLMTLLVVGLNQITRDWERQGGKLDEKIDESLVLLQIEKAIIGTFAYRFKEQELSQDELIFEGSKTELSWVSTVSPGRDSHLTFWHIEIDDDKGLLLNVLPVYPGNLFKQLEKAQDPGSYYFKDYKIVLHYLVATANGKKEWQSNWSGKEENKFPLGVRISLSEKDSDAGDKKEFSVFSFIRATADIVANSGRGGNSAFGDGSSGAIFRNRPKGNAHPPANPFEAIFKR